MGVTDDIKRKTEDVASEARKIKEDVKGKLGMAPQKPKDPYRDYGLLVIRVALAIFMIHGFQKLTGLDGTTAFFGNVGIPAAGVMAVVVGLVEFFGGLSMLLGVATRVFGALLSVVMVVAILAVKMKMGWPAFELELVLLFMAAGMALTGPGKYSLREMLTKNQPEHILNKL